MRIRIIKENKHRLVVGVFLVGAAFAFLYHRTATWFFSYDSLCYALDVETQSLAQMAHPFHLLPSFLNGLVFRGLLLFGYPLRALFVAQWINAGVAGAALAILAWLLQRRYGWQAALVGTVAFGFSHAFWVEAVDPGVYAWAGFWSCLLLGVLLGDISLSPLASGLLLGVAVLFHQMFLWIVPAFWISRDRPQRVPFLTGVFLTVGIVYGVVGWGWHGPSWQGVFHWLFGPATRPTTDALQGNYWSFHLWTDVRAAWEGLAYSLVVPKGRGMALAHGLMAFGTVFAVYGTWRSRREKSFHGKNITVLWAWILGLSFFPMVYAPGAIRFRILMLPACLLLLMELRAYRPKLLQRELALAVIGVMALVNFNQAIWPGMQAMRNQNLMRSLWVAHQLGPQDFFLYAGTGGESIINVNLVYFAPQVKARSLYGYFFGSPRGEMREIESFLQETRKQGGRVWMESALWDPGIQVSLESIGQRPPGTLARWLSRWKIQEERRSPLDYRIALVSNGTGVRR